MTRVLVLRQLQRWGRWRVGHDGVRAIELVAQPAVRWGFTTATRIYYRIRM